jgi:hypothetical protein
MMFGRQADALSGAKTSGMKDLSRFTAAQGIGNTGTLMRNVMEMNRKNGIGLREAGRDVEMADAEAKRSDLWNAFQGWNRTGQNWASGLGMKEQEYSDREGLAKFWADYQQKRQSPIKNFTNNFFSSFGSQLGNQAARGPYGQQS